MKQTIKRKWKAVLAVVCAFVMLFNLAGGNWFGQLPAEEVQAAESSNQPVDLSALTEITWSDFGVTDETIDTSPATCTKDLNNSIFNGNIAFGDGGDFRYGSKWFGLIFQLTGDGGLALSSHSFNFSDPTIARIYRLQEFGMHEDWMNDSFKGINFNLKIAMVDMSTDKTSVKVAIWINNIMLSDDFFTLTRKESNHENATWDNTLVKNADTVLAYEKSLDLPTAFPTQLKELSWGDFGIEDYAGAKVRFNVRGDVSLENDATVTADDVQNLTLRFYNSDSKGTYDELGSNFKEYTIQEKATYELYEIDLEWLLNSKGEFAGFTFATWNYQTYDTGAMYDVYITNIQIVKNEQVLKTLNLSETTFRYASSSSISDSANSGGKAAMSGDAIYSCYNYVWTAVSVDFKNVDNYTSLSSEWCNNSQGYTYADGLYETIFNGDIAFRAGGDFRYSATWGGIEMKLGEDGKLDIRSSFFDASSSFGQSYNASDFYLPAFKDTRFNLKVAVKDVSADNLSYTVGIWINNHKLGDDYIDLTRNSSGEEANASFNSNMVYQNISVYPASLGMPITEPEVTKITNLTWEDFGIIGGTSFSTYQGQTITSLKSLNNTLFSGDVSFVSGAALRYGGHKDAWTGIEVLVSDDDTLSLGTGDVANFTGLDKYTFSPSDVGLSTFINQRFHLQIAFSNVRSNRTANVQVSVNGHVLGGEFKVTMGSDYVLGTTLHMCTANDMTVTTYPKRAESLTNIGIADWKDVRADGKLANYEVNGEANAKVDTLLNTSFKEVVKFVVPSNYTGAGHLFCYGGTKGKDRTWYGIRIQMSNSSTMRLSYVNAAGSDSEVATVNAEDAGIGNSFYNTEFEWQIDTEKVGNNIYMYMYFDGELYNSIPFVFEGAANEISNTLVYQSCETNADACYVILDSATKTLPVLYHNLAKSEYNLPEGMTFGATSKNNKDKWVKDESLTAGDPLTSVGTYYVEFNDGVSDYKQEIVLYNTNNVAAKDLVHSLKLVKDYSGEVAEAVYATAQNRVCDIDLNGGFDTTDVESMRLVLVGSYDPLDTSKRMEIAGYYGPIQDKTITEAAYKKIQEAGITKIVYNGENDFSDNEVNRYRIYRQLAYAQKYGLTMTVYDSRLITAVMNGTTLTSEFVANAVKSYKDYQSFDSVFLFDEADGTNYGGDKKDETKPTIAQCETLASVLKDLGVECFGTLHKFVEKKETNSWTGSVSTIECVNEYNYTKYLEEYISKVGGNYLTYDYYPFQQSEIDAGNVGNGVGNSANYFKNLAMTRYNALKNSKQFVTFIQAGDGFGNTTGTSHLVTKGEMLWNANTSLAFGAKGLDYFLLIQHQAFANSNGEESSGLLQTDGTTENAWYGYAKEFNKHVQAIDEVLMQATSAAIMSTSGYAQTQVTEVVGTIEGKENKYSWTDKKTVATTGILTSYNNATVTSNDSTYGALTGCFEVIGGKYKGKHALYIVNFNPENSNMITVNFTGGATTATYIMNGEITTETGTSVSKTLGAGEAVLVVY